VIDQEQRLWQARRPESVAKTCLDTKTIEAAAAGYRRWLDHLRPKLLLGLTATPPIPGRWASAGGPWSLPSPCSGTNPARPTCCS